MSHSNAIAADLLGVPFGPAGALIISAIIAIAAITSGVCDGKRGTPANALKVQCAAALLLVLVGAWTGSGFKSMVEFTAPVFWVFLLLSGISLFVLRLREPDTPYPLVPLAFCAMCA